ncbi:MAG: aminotransferase class I/II-fold pyridoxal phosphate-dependent enzyme [Limnochordia bacterium]|jgi:aminotransferase|nr:aminotransferase class I/II-fold pyridoxal phosphate-dependent enzyme [Limnochordia bacterium]MDD2628549.1 aminotransferase class I/II-fold pyridoxal phosphate-dependent enzyme [Limnochordia bacterium]MDD4517688.1 aminotransferase class I/II-fold pyridoxal phosphate-dependent enzyme [Limnochordia bacterium]
MNRDFVSPVIKSLAPSGIRRFFDLVADMDDVVSLGIGEPDFVTPWRIREAALHSLKEGYTMYTSNQGLLELRNAISDYWYENMGMRYNPKEEIIVTVGVSEALDLLMRTILTPGDEVIMAEPCYVSYQPTVILAGGVPRTIPTTMEDGFQLRVDELEKAINERTKAVLLCSPNNPTGTVLTSHCLADIARVAVKYDLLVITDEIYSELVYDGKYTSIAQMPGMRERAIVLNGFSKTYAMTGWRIGYALGRTDVIKGMNKIHQYTMLCAPITSQKAAIEALRNCHREKAAMRQEYNERRRLIVKGLNEVGLECSMPQGAFYVFPSVRSTGLDAETFCEQLLKQEKVAVVPGTAFGSSGEGFVRCSYAASIDEIKEALERIGRFVENNSLRKCASGEGA